VLEQVKLDGNPLLQNMVRSVKSRAYRSILARLPDGCKLVDDSTSMPSGPLFTPPRSTNKDRLAPGSSSSGYSERRRRQGTPISTTGKSRAGAGGGSWPRRAEPAAQRNGGARGGTIGQDGSFDNSSVAVDLSAPRAIDSRDWDHAHTLSSLVPPDDDTEPYRPAIRADNLHANATAVAVPSPRATIFSTGGTGRRPTSPLQQQQQRSRRHWSPSGRRRDTNEAKVKAVGPRSSTNKHLSFRAKDQQRRAAAASVTNHSGDVSAQQQRLREEEDPSSSSSLSSSNLMTPTKSIESKYARSSPPRSRSRSRSTQRDDDGSRAEDANPSGRLAGHPGWPASPPPSVPQRQDVRHGSRTDAAALVPSPSANDPGGRSGSRRAKSAPRRRARQSPSPSRLRGSPNQQEVSSASASAYAVASARADDRDDNVVEAEAEAEAEAETVKGLNAKITKLYNWHLTEMDMVQKQQLQLNQVTAELEQTRSALHSQEQLLRLQLAADSDGIPIGNISMSETTDGGGGSNDDANDDGGSSYNSSQRFGTGDSADPDQSDRTAIGRAAAVEAAVEAAVAAINAPPLDGTADAFGSAGEGRRDSDGHLSADISTLSTGDRPSVVAVLPPEPTIDCVELSGIPLSTPVKLQDLQAELSGTVDELTVTRKALGHALTIMQSAGIADGKLKPLRAMLHQSGVTSPGRASPELPE
jgi:hypothetical protein